MRRKQLTSVDQVQTQNGKARNKRPEWPVHATESEKKREKEMRQPRIERGAHRWQRWILPLNHWRF